MNKPRELEYIAKKRQESKAFKNFVRGISNDITKANYVEWLRNDSVGLREKILNMIVEERKRLGINKSTLCHIKKNLSEGKISKIYDKIILKIL